MKITKEEARTLRAMYANKAEAELKAALDVMCFYDSAERHIRRALAALRKRQYWHRRS